MKFDNGKLFVSDMEPEKVLHNSSDYLLNRIINIRKNILKTKPPLKIGKIFCKNGCRLGSD